jgi:hypothetical protein
VPSYDIRGCELRSQLADLLGRIGESPDLYSEPDVILDFSDAGLVFIEVKYKSPNEVTKDLHKFERYFCGSTAFSDQDRITTSGLYELARNWAIACRLAAGRPVTLVNLVRRSSAESVRMKQFEAGISGDKMRTFRQIQWSKLLGAVPRQPWLQDYLDALKPTLHD